MKSMRTEFPLRLAVLLSFFAIPLAAVAQTALPAPVEGHDVTEIGPGYYTFRHKGLRNIFLVTKAGVIVTDPIEPEAARVLREEIRKITPLPVKYVVYSHQHWDHVRGGRIFKEEGAKFVSHANCVAHFKDLPEPEIVMPDETFTGERHELRLGERTLKLRYLGPNHGDCLIVMTPDHVNVPFIVDLGTAGGMPLPYIADYSLHNWVRSLRELESWDFESYVGGHGIAIAPKNRLTERREYVEGLMQETRRELDAGTPLDRIPDIVAARLQTKFAHLRGFNAIVRDNVRRTITYYGMGW
ncbi:MAG: MBL fold metallo-hydrolase [Gammaproteobacteria bacterium]|nr:MBL fold metallo-hydrolase [Gammaproteobacteria bacterium]